MLGFMYLRYTQPPADLYDWYEDYLQDEEEIDVKAGGGQVIPIGQMVYQFLTKLDWFSTLFPRIPVPIQKQIEKKLEQYCRTNGISLHQLSAVSARGGGKPTVQPNPINEGGLGGGGSSGSGRAYTEEDYDSRRGSGGSRAPPPVNYRTEHDDRDFYRERRRDFDLDSYPAVTNDRERERERDRYRDYERSRERERGRREYEPEPDKERERQSDKSKKKKHKHRRSRSRSHSASRSRSRREHKREREGRERDEIHNERRHR